MNPASTIQRKESLDNDGNDDEYVHEHDDVRVFLHSCLDLGK